MTTKLSVAVHPTAALSVISLAEVVRRLKSPPHWPQNVAGTAIFHILTVHHTDAVLNSSQSTCIYCSPCTVRRIL